MIPKADQFIQKTLTAYEYAYELNHHPLADLIHRRLDLPSFQQRFLSVLKLNDVRRCDKFIRNLCNENRQQTLARDGFFHASQLGSVRLLDYFLSQWKIDINIGQISAKNFATTALLTAITHQQNDAAKFLLFRGADPSIKGEYDNALVTALQYQSKNYLIRLLLDKNVDLTARHPNYEKLTLREYCVLTNRVQAKTELDAYIVRLINEGNYKRLKWLVDRGYKHINVHVSYQRNGRQLAEERYQDKIVQLIDDIANAEIKARTKMNY
ncbi:unnamed protein product [Adineta ricciae]|uniref:Uncharacterized protein n=1 Tax=Adineta ricciae TaxID=249248 RepID=A0A816C248_ADIRI|nr:unnamed protein product [Adineta ricciae]CAF1617769.1 unnamed protein product [Adineta ricciae]